MSSINDLAIVLTQKIEQELFLVCAEVTRADEKTIRAAPNFGMIRTAIMKALERYMDVLFVETKTSPEAERDMPPDVLAQFRRHQIQKSAVQIVEGIMDSEEHFKVIDTADEWGRWRNTVRSIVVLKTALLSEESR